MTTDHADSQQSSRMGCAGRQMRMVLTGSSVASGCLIFISGQVGVDEAGQPIADPEAQFAAEPRICARSLRRQAEPSPT